MVDVHPILEVTSKLTVAGLLALVAIALVRGWVVPRYRYLELQREILELKVERNQWRRLALQGTRIADSAVRMADHAVQFGGPPHTAESEQDHGQLHEK